MNAEPSKPEEPEEKQAEPQPAAPVEPSPNAGLVADEPQPPAEEPKDIFTVPHGG